MDILVIDDDPQMRRLLARILRGAGHTVREASNGRRGIELFREAWPALVITDIVMPETEGIETIRELHREAPAIPILAISGVGSPIYLRAATSMGAVASLAKPFEVDQLLAIVAKLLETPHGAPRSAP